MTEINLLPIEQLLAAARQGSAQSLAELLVACRDYLLAIANSELQPSLQGKIGASDLVQETFVAAYNNFADFRGHSEAELLGWLRVILINQMTSTVRFYRFTEKRRVDREVPLAAQAKAVSTSRNPVSELLREENIHRLRTAIQQLSEPHRSAIELRSIEQLSFVEIGQRLGRSEEAARKLWGRALLMLCEMLESKHDST